MHFLLIFTTSKDAGCPLLLLLLLKNLSEISSSIRCTKKFNQRCSHQVPLLCPIEPLSNTFAMPNLHPTSRMIAQVVFQAVVACSIVVFALYIFFPGSLFAAQNVVNNFPRPATTELSHVKIGKIIKSTSIIIITIFSIGRNIFHHFQFSRSALIRIVHQTFWSDIMIEVDNRVQLFRDWFLALQNVII